MSQPRPLRILVIGDPYMPVSAYADALAGLKQATPDDQIELSTMQIDEVAAPPPGTESERGLREYMGDPAEVARAVAGHDVLIVHGAPVTAEVLGAAPLRLVCCAVPAGSGGVIAIVSNVMNAKRWAHASPSFLQFDLANPAVSGRGACVRAIEEAAAYVARGHRDIITGLTGLQFGEAVFTGGAGRGRLWPQIMANVLGVPVHIPAVTESSALGAAICAGVGAGVFSDLLELRPGLRRRAATFEPDPAAAAAYDEQYASWREIYRRMLAITDDGLLNPLWRAAGA